MSESLGREEVKTIVDAAMARAHNEILQRCSENCRQHRTEVTANLTILRDAQAASNLTTEKLATALSQYIAQESSRAKTLENTVEQLAKIYRGNGSEKGFNVRVSLLETALVSIQTTLGDTRAIIRRAIIQALPVVVTWIGFLVYWVIVNHGRGGP